MIGAMGVKFGHAPAYVGAWAHRKLSAMGNSFTGSSSSCCLHIILVSGARVHRILGATKVHRCWAEGGAIPHDFAFVMCLWRGPYYDKIKCLLSVAWCDGLAWWFCLGAGRVVLASCSEVGVLGAELCSADLII